MSLMKRFLSVALAASMVASTFIMPAMAEEAAVTETVDLSQVYAHVTASSQMAGAYALAPEAMYVVGDKAESYGYTDTVKDGVSTLDVLVAETEKMFGSDFTKDTKDDYLVLNESGWISTVFGMATGGFGFLVNDKQPTTLPKTDYGYTGLMINQAKVTDGDVVKFYLYEDESYYMDTCVTFKDAAPARIKPGESVDVELRGYIAAFYGAYEDEIPTYMSAVEDASFGILEEDGTVTPLDGIASDEDGKASVKFDNAGAYTLVAYGYDVMESPLIMATKQVYVQPELQDGTYTETAQVRMADWKAYYSYPKADYDVDVTLLVKDGKVADLYFTQDTHQMKMAFDRNYMIWAMNGHKVTNPNYLIEKYVSKKTKAYPINETGLTEQVVANNGTYGCDTVSSATITADVVLKAVDKAIARAATGAKDEVEALRPAEDTTDAILPEDGVYYAGLECDSAKIHNKEAILYVKDGKMKMTVAIEQRESSYPMLFAGEEAEAWAAGEEAWQKPYADYDYGYTYPGSLYVNVPVKSLDKVLPFVMFAKSSGNWFNRQMFMASEDLLKIEEGVYAADEFTFEGGTGHVTMTCDNIYVKDGEMVADITVNSVKMTQAVVMDQVYEPVVDKDAGTSTFTVPFNPNAITKITVTTMAMSAPHDVEYTFMVKMNLNNLKPGKKEASTVTLKGASKNYTGKAVIASVEAQTGSTAEPVITYYSDAACTQEIEAPKMPGTYYAKATVAGDAFYEAAESEAVKIVINKLASTITLKAKSANYTGKAIAVAKAKVTGSTGKVTYTYYSDKACTKKVTAHTNAGTYYVKAKVAADKIYKAATSKAVTLTIKPIVPAVKAKVASKTYKASAVKKAAKSFTIGITTKSKGKITYKSSNKKITVTTKGKVTVKKGTPKGKYTITVTVAAKGNYKKATKKITVTVK